MYFHNSVNGTFEEVPNGGLLVYYLQRGNADRINGGPGLTAFPPGFRMITGDPKRRSLQFPWGMANQDQLRQRAIEWVCLTTGGAQLSDNFDSGAGFPSTDCIGGFNARLQMPNCWDGVNLDSPDHISHTAFMSTLDNGVCPPDHPVALMTILFEVTWDVHSFVTSGKWNPNTQPWPFVYANGDPTGYGWHGDFYNGWPDGLLQVAIDQCNTPSNSDQMNGVTEACPLLTVLPVDQVTECKRASVVNEPVSGILTKLPGCNPIQRGPQNATLYSASNCPT
ncbi:hypothetical protein M422DRAFT_234799 [Sphaerobolus stellatus SS14]|uniref:DUF1996 domain-containing protein n=1 Tax=Sphaerobolus stellatus (strain SS14) TaxID=990650 RepID=A0A0C9U810_SPHS4|nr:hypothetical protein M422DRAFT_234799 [Sphaerobolus stellatus SS14]